MKKEFKQIVLGVGLAIIGFLVGYSLFINTCDKYSADGTWTQGCKCLGKRIDKQQWLGKFTYGEPTERQVMCVGYLKTTIDI